MKLSNDMTLIGIITAIVGAFMVLRHIRGIIDRINKILEHIAESIRLTNERKRQDIDKQRARQLIWMKLIRNGQAEIRLKELDAAFWERRKELRSIKGKHHDHR